MGSSSMVPTVSPGGMYSAGRSSQLASSTTRYGDRDSRSPSVSTTAATPGDMFVPLSTVSGGSSSGNMFGMDSFQGQNGFAQLASFMKQQSSSPVSSQNPTLTPSLSELFTLSPSHISNDGIISFIPPALTTATAGNGLTAGMFSMANTGPAVSLPSLLQQSAAYQAHQPAKTTAVADTNMRVSGGGRSSSPLLPAHLMAYRNPDPLLAADDGDQLEKLLLNSMYPVKAPVEDAQPEAPGEVLCTCRSCDQTSCPKHGSPGDMSEEMRDMAPQLLNFVCNETNTMADEELNDLCSLMYKHAKCSDIQKRVEMVRDKIKADSELEMFQTKQKLAKQYGLQ
ncbi:hypothetical protein GGI13_007609 [Coemansia sp. RSA 455]|nr:hypothetical protein GGI13_007609 [Coemansia sp. RSA 455]